MRATAAPEEGNKVRLSVRIDETEIDEALDGVLRRLAREVRVPGFRPGKVPRRVIEARMGGSTALRTEALREALPEFYARAVSDTEVDPIDQPEIDITSGDEEGAVSFDAVVAVRPSISIAGYQGLRVTLPALGVPEADVTAQIDRMRATSGVLREVSRPAQDGDQATIDILGIHRPTESGSDDTEVDAAAGEAPGPDDEDLTAEDFLYEVGSGGLVPELDEHLLGSKAGDTVSFVSTNEALGRTVDFRVEVKDIKELVLPEVTDAWAAEASEFSTADELVADVTERLRRVRLIQAKMALQQRAVGALVELVVDEIPDVLVNEELRERIHDLNHRLEQQGISVDQFLAATGRYEQEFLDELRTSAISGVKADLALRALADAEGIELTDDELGAELETMAERLEMSTEAVRDQLEQGGRLPAVRSERRKAKAMTWLLDHVELVDEDGAPVSRDDLQANQGEEDSQ